MKRPKETAINMLIFSPKILSGSSFTVSPHVYIRWIAIRRKTKSVGIKYIPITPKIVNLMARERKRLGQRFDRNYYLRNN